jgi:cytochrome b
MTKLKVWDLPTRLFHWTLVVAVVGLVVTGNVGGNAMTWHMRLGFVVFALLLFRLVWGLVGGHWSRFVVFVPSPARLWAYLRGRDTESVGHNPLGALSVLTMMTVLSLQVGSGLVSDDEIAFTGPLVALVSGDTVSAATHYHKGLGKLLLLGLLGLHIGAIVYHQRIKKKPLVQGMVTGDWPMPPHPIPPSTADGARQRWLALAVAVASAVTVAWVVSLGG